MYISILGNGKHCKVFVVCEDRDSYRINGGAWGLQATGRARELTEVRYINPAELCRLHNRYQAFATAGLTCRLADLLPPNLCRDSFDSLVRVAMGLAAGAITLLLT